jgi:Icc protein
MSDYIKQNLDHDGVDRRGFLKCMAWAGTGTLCLLQGGVLKSFALTDVLQKNVGNLKGDLSFVQISDSHIGFNKPANPDVTATLREAIAKVNALPNPPSFVLHTGDLTHLSKPEEFDTLAESLKSLKTDKIFYIPGSTTSSMITAKPFMSGSAKGRKATVGTASTRRVRISLDWSM